MDSCKNINLSSNNKRKKLILGALATVLLVSALIGIVVGVKSKNSTSNDKAMSQSITVSSAHEIVKSSCSTTLYPELCYSTVASHPEVSTKAKSQKDVIELAINVTQKAVQLSKSKIEKLSKRKGLTPHEYSALKDCLEMVAETVDELNEVTKGLEEYDTKKLLKKHAEDLKTLMSSAITDQSTCLDGFSHDEADKKVRKELEKLEERVEKMCSNALAMICNMTNTDIANENKLKGRNLKEENLDDSEWPKWMSVKDRKLLQSGTVRPNVVVAADGSGNYRTVAAAVAAAPSKSSTRYVIRIKAGVYRENVEVPSSKTNIMFMGDGRKNTIITGSKSVKGGATTFESATVDALCVVMMQPVVGDGFLARLALHSKRQQDSPLRPQRKHIRQFYINCLIAGTVDFIFGNAAAVFQDCDIHARRPNSGQKNMLTAQGRTDSNQNTGIVIQKCRIGATSDLLPVQGSFPTYLGRPWKQYARTVFMQSTISNVIHPAGWHEWDGNFALDTLYYGEYQNTGAGAGTSNRVKWKGFKVITSSTEAQGFTPGSFIGGGSWLRSTGFPFSLGKNKQTPQDSVRTTSDVDLKEFCEKHYEKLLPIMADKYEYEKRKKEKLEEVKGGSTLATPGRRALGHKNQRILSPGQYRQEDKDALAARATILASSLETRKQRTEYIPKHSDSRQKSSRYTENYSESEDSECGHWKSKLRRKKSSVEDDDLPQPWVCAETDPFTSRIRHFDFPKTRMPSHVKTYNEAKILKITENLPWQHKNRDCGCMPTWSHMFNSTHHRKRVGCGMTIFTQNHIYSYNDLREVILETTIPKQKVQSKTPKVLHNIKQKTESPQKTSTKEILALEKGKFKTPPPMTTPVEKRNANKFYEFHGEVRHNTDESTITLLVKIGDVEHSTSTWMDFMVVRLTSPHNGIIGRPGLRKIQAVPSTTHKMIKFLVTRGILTLKSSKIIPVECAMVSGPDEQPIPVNKVREERVKVAINPEHPEQTVMIGSNLTEKTREKLCNLLQRSLDIFAWTPTDMTGVPRHIAEHRLNVRKGCQPVRQKKRGQAAERNIAINDEVSKLVTAGIMREVHYHDWLSNPVMVKKSDNSWRMCVDFKHLNKACPKDGYPLLEIDWKVESLCGFPFKCFLDAYKGYHQIQMAEEDEEKTAFITNQGIFCYIKMPFGLRNVGATYQRLVDKAFHGQIGRNLEVYVDDLVIKSRTEDEVVCDIEETFKTLRKINMKLNLKKCTFGVEEGMFLGYQVNTKGIKICPDKIDAVLSLQSPKCLKDVQKLNGKLASLNMFLAKSAEKSLPFFKTLKKCTKKSNFLWTREAEAAFRQMKEHIAKLPMLTAPEEQEELIVYLAASKEAEREARQMPIYFVIRALRGPEVNYTPMEKVVLALVHASKRLRRYFQAHPIIVITDQPIKTYYQTQKSLVGCKSRAYN
ncbi:pectinesterase/pectinesterase inhibitor U1 [Tanacetum coccineum]